MNIMREYCKEKIKNLIALRTNLFTTLIVLISGIVGLFFANAPALKLFPFGIAGSYFTILFLLNIISINKQIDMLTEGLK